MSNYITIDHLSELHWKNAPENTYVKHKSIVVWRIEVLNLIASLEKLKDLLSTAEIEKAMRYQQEADRNRKFISRAVLRILLSRYLEIDPKEILFKTDQNQKLCIENKLSEPIYFNVSHSGNYILIAIDNNSVGIDVEQIDTSFTYQNIMSFCFSRQEIDFVENSTNPIQAFYQLWTRKESLLKATGKGLVDDLATIPSLNGLYPNTISKSAQIWQVSSFKVDENHVGSVAFYPIKTALEFFNFEL